MLSSGVLGTVCAAALFAGSSSALAVKRDATTTRSGPLSFTFSSYIGDATPTNIHYVTMDGGGGGVLNGNNVAIFSDTTTSNSDGKMVGGGFVSNSAYYIPDTSNPLAMEGFETGGVPELAVPWFEDECVAGASCEWWCWPDSALATQNNLASDTVGYGMYDIGRREGSDEVWEYKTLAKLTANDTALTVTRPVQQYITSSFLYRWGWSIGSDGDGYVHVFAKGGTNANGTINMYAAKVPFDDIEDTSKFLYFNGNDYTFNSEADAVPVAAGYLDSGDVFYSAHYSTWLIVSMGSGDAIDYIYVQYSTTGMARGPYSEPQNVIKTAVATNSYNSHLHSYPQFFDATSQEILTSWSFSNGTIIQMAKLTFDP
ncbi:MAG: hypothetical protein ASARMPRED_008956 [Alectoria sarmentosa]|nr:MAG: hypothetical protein ASARMPRED_008956 [Alectoria sarmentosa]